MINGMPHQLFAGGLKARGIYPEIKKNFYREHSNVTWEEFLTTKHPSQQWQDSGKYITSDQKAPEASNEDLTCYVLSFEDAVAHISVTDPSGILTIER